MSADSKVHLSVVLPVYECDPCLRPLFSRLKKAMETITADWEAIFVDDGSLDNGWETLQDLYKSDNRVVLVKLSKNFGQNAAITAGLSHAKGDWVVVMDCDLQDPPKKFQSFIKKR